MTEIQNTILNPVNKPNPPDINGIPRQRGEQLRYFLQLNEQFKSEGKPELPDWLSWKYTPAPGDAKLPAEVWECAVERVTSEVRDVLKLFRRIIDAKP